MLDGWDESSYFLAGERVESGRYRQVGSGRELVLQTGDVLPASFDGRVACYERVHQTWREISEFLTPGAASEPVSVGAR